MQKVCKQRTAPRDDILQKSTPVNNLKAMLKLVKYQWIHQFLIVHIIIKPSLSDTRLLLCVILVLEPGKWFCVSLKYLDRRMKHQRGSHNILAPLIIIIVGKPILKSG